MPLKHDVETYPDATTSALMDPPNTTTPYLAVMVISNDALISD
jgi:hypothetical protein